MAIGCVWHHTGTRVQGSAEAHMNRSPKTLPVKADSHASTHKYARSNGVPLIISEACKNCSAYSLRPVEYLLAGKRAHT